MLANGTFYHHSFALPMALPHLSLFRLGDIFSSKQETPRTSSPGRTTVKQKVDAPDCGCRAKNRITLTDRFLFNTFQLHDVIRIDYKSRNHNYGFSARAHGRLWDNDTSVNWKFPCKCQIMSCIASFYSKLGAGNDRK